MLIIDVFHDAALFQAGCLKTACEGAVFFPEPLLVHQQAEAFFKAELMRTGAFQLLAEGLGHAVQFHDLEFLDGGLIQHAKILFRMELVIAAAWWADRSTALRERSEEQRVGKEWGCRGGAWDDRRNRG